MARKSKAGPASDPELLILSSLASGPKHGYAIKSDIQSIAGIDIGPGTLYTAIARLVEKRWISPLAEKGRQRPYELTAHGSEQLEHQLEQMRRLATVGLGRLRSA
jgi:DNA-binding PadR family transcriptional regulator